MSGVEIRVLLKCNREEEEWRRASSHFISLRNLWGQQTRQSFDHQRTIWPAAAQRIYGELGDKGKAQGKDADWLVIPAFDQMLIMRSPMSPNKSSCYRCLVHPRELHGKYRNLSPSQRGEHSVPRRGSSTGTLRQMRSGSRGRKRHHAWNT